MDEVGWIKGVVDEIWSLGMKDPYIISGIIIICFLFPQRQHNSDRIRQLQVAALLASALGELE